MFGISKKRAIALGVVAATLATGITIGATTFADDGSDVADAPPSEPGTPIVSEEAPSGDAASPNLTEAIQTSGTNYDPTILTKFIPAKAFGTQDAGSLADLTTLADNCVTPDATSPGGSTDLYAPVELPDGARIKRLTFFGEDDVATNISISLQRTNIAIPILIGGSPTRTSDTISSFNTSAADLGVVVVAGPDNLEEQTGSFNSGGFILSPTSHRFHQVHVSMPNAGAGDHVLCGVEVQYQVAAPAGDAGSVFHPISPVRAYDSRIAAYGATAGTFAPNANKVISIADAHDLTTGAVVTADVVPANATAITYNLVAAGATGPNFLAITPGDAAAFGASAINMGGATLALANGGTVAIAADRTVKVWLGGGPGSSDVVLDVTGYYAPPLATPNMAG
jgi:hypothetical protein